MKKTYINPAMVIVKIQTQHQMLAGSTLGMQGDYDSSDVTIGSRELELDEEFEDDFDMDEEEI